MVLRFDTKLMSSEGFIIKHTKKIHQSHNFMFGVPTEIDMEVIWCEKCNKECKTGNVTTGYAFYGKCEKCDMEYFR
jgi:hypothetical protein